MMLALCPLVLAPKSCAEQRGHAGPAALFMAFSLLYRNVPAASDCSRTRAFL